MKIVLEVLAEKKSATKSAYIHNPTMLNQLKEKAKRCIDDIFVSPASEDASTQTDFEEEPLKNVIRKRKAEFWDIFESVCGEDTFFSRHVTVNPSGSKGKQAEGGAGAISDIESSPLAAHSLSSRSGTAESTVADSVEVWTRQRTKLMREVAATTGIQYADDSALDTLFHGQTNHQLIEKLDEVADEPDQPAPPAFSAIAYEEMMSFGKIEPGAYDKLDKEMRRKYCAGIMSDLYTLIGEHKRKPSSLRAIATMYNVPYDHLYDIWRGRACNPYLTVHRPACVQNLR